MHDERWELVVGRQDQAKSAHREHFQGSSTLRGRCGECSFNGEILERKWTMSISTSIRGDIQREVFVRRCHVCLAPGEVPRKHHRNNFNRELDDISESDVF